ncbi:hypothetical protein ACTNDY_06665 [Tissierellaceae bacterium HCP3S3_D8]
MERKKNTRVLDTGILSEQYTKLIIETEEENPMTIAEVTNIEIKPAIGYRVRLVPNYD